jgi:acyl-coenzyme A synthetase/AMP-(fatty) acid ligase
MKTKLYSCLMPCYIIGLQVMTLGITSISSLQIACSHITHALAYWQTIEKYRLTQFYSMPTAICLLCHLGVHHIELHDRSLLHMLGSVGEPINPEAWNWYYEHVGRCQCAIVDTFWQTETGSIVITPFPGAVEMKPRLCDCAVLWHQAHHPRPHDWKGMCCIAV